MSKGQKPKMPKVISRGHERGPSDPASLLALAASASESGEVLSAVTRERMREAARQLRAAPAAEPGAAAATPGPWPMASEVDRKGGWTYAPEFLGTIADAAETLGDDGRPSMEQVEGVLKALAGAPGRAAPNRERMAAAIFAADDEASHNVTWDGLHPHFKAYWHKLAEAAMRTLRAGDAPPGGQP